MTPTEVLKEIRKMPPAQKRRVLRELSEQFDPSKSNGLNAKEKSFSTD